MDCIVLYCFVLYSTVLYLNEGQVEKGHVAVESLEQESLHHEVVLVFLFVKGRDGTGTCLLFRSQKNKTKTLTSFTLL